MSTILIRTVGTALSCGVSRRTLDFSLLSGLSKPLSLSTYASYPCDEGGNQLPRQSEVTLGSLTNSLSIRKDHPHNYIDTRCLVRGEGWLTCGQGVPGTPCQMSTTTPYRVDVHTIKCLLNCGLWKFINDYSFCSCGSQSPEPHQDGKKKAVTGRRVTLFSASGMCVWLGSII